MKRIAVFSFLLVLVLAVVFSGCTSSTPAPQPVVTPAATATTATPVPTATPDPYPNATPLTTPSAFGSGTRTGELTVTGYTVRPTYSWVDPSWNSPKEQAASSNPLETQKGYNTKKPAEGNTFIFVYLTAACTGSEAVYAPSPAQIVVASEGKTYSYTPLATEKTIVDGELGKQYDYQIGSGGTGGYVQPGKSNTVKGFLIYEVPASFSPEKTYIIANAGAQTRSIWRLA